MAEPKRSPIVFLAVPIAILGVMLGLQYFSPQEAGDETSNGETPAETQAAPSEQAELAPSAPDDAPTAGTTLTAAEVRSRTESQNLYVLEDTRIRASFTDLNTGLVSLSVKGDRYLDENADPFELVTTDKEQYLPLQPKFSGIEVPADARWTVVESSDRTIHFRWSGDDVTIDRTWELAEPPYQFQVSTQVHNQGTTDRQVTLHIDSAHYVRREDEKGGFFGRPSPALSHGICQVGDDTVREDREGLLSEDELRPLLAQTFGPGVEYIALSSVYFAIIAAPEGQTAERCQLLSTNRGGTPKDPDGSLFEATLTYPPVEVKSGETTTFRMAVYAGPKDFDALEKFGHQATNVIDLGWFSFIARGMSWLLRFIYDFIGNWGFAIILLTILVRVLLLPFVIPQFRNMAKQRALKPEIDKINELFKDDREKKGAAMMELWRKNKVNPLGGCLPVLLQMPIFFALYQTLSTSIELYHAPFIWWWTDLSSPDPFYVLPIILGALMFIQQKLTPVQMDPTQAKVMLYAMPLMMTFFMLLLPTGLCLYMVTSSAIGITQQRYMYWQMDKEQMTVVSAIDDDDDAPEGQSDQAAGDNAAAALKQAKPRRKKRTRRGRA
ncbi:MAG: membrane protein insertase YidC [Polyangiales bacterium]